MISYEDAARIVRESVLPRIVKLYGLDGCDLQQIGAHEGGRNLVYRASGKSIRIIRISYLPDRNREDFLAETEYVRYLHENGASVANVIASRDQNLLEVFKKDKLCFYVCVFENAPGENLADQHYRYREGAPLSEYFCNCGKTLGKIHSLSKTYTPHFRRYDFFDKYNNAYIDELIPNNLLLLKQSLKNLLAELRGLDQFKPHYGMVHFDYSDGNFRIDYATGKINVFDFDNCCNCWYMFDLANLWRNGVGWIRFEPDKNKRRAFMEDYFKNILAGYRLETELDGEMLSKLPLFVQTVLMENLLDVFEVQRFSGKEAEIDEEQMYCIKCTEENIPYLGFFHEIYDCRAPFELSCE